jgi:hypothetical protein
MSEVSEKIEWHLTRFGWVQGSTEEYLSIVKPTHKTPPEYRLLSYEVLYSTNEMYGTPVGALATLLWIKPELTLEERSLLFKQFPPPWRSFGSHYSEV